jgi:hypothetical protein
MCRGPDREAVHLRLAGAHVCSASRPSLWRSWRTPRAAIPARGERRRNPAGVLESARVLALFTIGETPWTDGQRTLIRERL